MVRSERNHSRSLAWSLRHRAWGDPCYLTDVDGLWIECLANAEPVLIVEKKDRLELNGGFNEDFIVTWQARAVKRLGELANLPAVLIIWDSRTYSHHVYPLNQQAIKWFAKCGELLSEQDYVRRLYEIRCVKPDKAIIELLSGMI